MTEAQATSSDPTWPPRVVIAAINASNPVLVDARDSQSGVAPSIARALGVGLGLPVEMVLYPTAGDVAANALDGRWDIALIAADPARSTTMNFSRPYARIPATYLVPRGAIIPSSGVDSDGITVIAEHGSAYHLWLEAHLTKARLVSCPNASAAQTAFASHKDWVLAGLRSTLEGVAESSHGTVLGTDFMHIDQAIAVALHHGAAGLRDVDDVVSRLIETGAVARIVRDAGKDAMLVVGT